MTNIIVLKRITKLVVLLFSLISELGFGQIIQEKINYIINIERNELNKKRIDSNNLFFLLEEQVRQQEDSYLLIDKTKFLMYYMGINRLGFFKFCCADTNNLQPLNIENDETYNLSIADYFKHNKKVFVINTKKFIIKMVSFVDSNSYCKCSKTFVDVSDYPPKSKFSSLIKPIKSKKISNLGKKNFKNNIDFILKFINKEYGFIL